MTAQHPDLQTLAKQILAVIDPLLEAATAALAASPLTEPGKCRQAWCPACATAAVMSGEQHPMRTIVAEHGAALLMVLRAMANSEEVGPTPPPTETAAEGRQETSPELSRYQPIPVIVHETT